MTKLLTMLAFLLSIAAGAARAEDDCFAPMADWQPRDAVEALADAQGWSVRRIRIHDGCYRIKGADAEGRKIEVTVHPQTLEVIEFEYEDDDDGHGRDRDRDRDQQGGAGHGHD